jgi:hypothetical protein
MPKLQKNFSRWLNHSRAASELRVVRHLNQVRRVGVLVTAAAGGVLLVTGPALADVTVNPPTAPQGEGADLAFHVTNSGTQPITALKLTWPADTPVAEVYPLSVADWAPKSTMQKLNTPLDTIHGGTPVTEVARDITWIAMPGTSLAPGAATDLSVSLGPLPTLSSMPFTVVPTYAGGQTGTAMPASVKLTPLTPEQAAALHAGHDATGTSPTAQDPDAALFAQTVAQADRGPGVWTIAGWVTAALALLGAIWFVLRNRRIVEDDLDEPEEEEPEKEPVTAGAVRVTSWSYRDGPEG